MARPFPRFEMGGKGGDRSAGRGKGSVGGKNEKAKKAGLPDCTKNNIYVFIKIYFLCLPKTLKSAENPFLSFKV